MIIGLTGQKRSGKNTAAIYIQKHFDAQYEVIEHSFAGKLKQSAVAAITGKIMSEEHAIKWCEEMKEHFVFDVIGRGIGVDRFTGREYLQWYGTEGHRKIFGQDFWTNIVLDKIPAWNQPSEWESKLHIITDVRFSDEVRAIKAKGGKIARICRPGIGELKDSHISEQGVPDELIDIEIWNDGSLEELEFRVIDATKELIKWQR